jgi:predicted O-linked N-acetylglucosamine transferase (SPINDLY family)
LLVSARRGGGIAGWGHLLADIVMNIVHALENALAAHHAGQLAEAAVIYRQVLAVEPAHADALYLLARLEHTRGHLADAESLVRRAVAAAPSEASFRLALADVLRDRGQSDSAIAAYRDAIALRSDYALAFNNLGNVLRARQAIAEAETAFRTAVRLQPDFPEVHNNLGSLLREQGRLEEAGQHLARALELRPDFAEAHSNLGNVRRDEGNFDAAVVCYRRAIASAPRFVAAHFNLGNVLRKLGHSREALASYQNSVQLSPGDAEALTNLGVTCQELGDLDGAVAACRRAIELRPDFALAQGNLAVCLHNRGEIEIALAHYRLAVKLAPGEATHQSHLAHALNYAPGVTADEVFAEHVRWGRRFADPLTPTVQQRTPRVADKRRLRIGYVSPFFREHAVSVFVEPLLAHHDHQQFEVFCYSDALLVDGATHRMRESADQWVESATLSDEQLARRIVDDQVDLLVDLTGHLDGNRLLTFARKPAAVQVTYLGYQNTTGMRAMDYRLTDSFADPPGATDALHTERLVRLPGAFFCYQPLRAAPPVGDLPAVANGYATFGSFNKFAKVTADVLSAWARILSLVTNSRLMILMDPSEIARRRVQSVCARHGVCAERIAFVEKRPRTDYLRLHQQVDVVLDSFPFNGHTTTCEALWMGVPVVMLAGATYVTRFGGSALVHLGLGDLIATTPDGYVDVAARLAGDVERLRWLRQDLRGQMLASPLLDAAGFTKNVEAAYRRMWADWCADQR